MAAGIGSAQGACQGSDGIRISSQGGRQADPAEDVLPLLQKHCHGGGIDVDGRKTRSVYIVKLLPEGFIGDAPADIRFQPPEPLLLYLYSPGPLPMSVFRSIRLIQVSQFFSFLILLFLYFHTYFRFIVKTSVQNKSPVP